MAELEKIYILMPQTSTYALGVHALQEACVAENNQHQPQITLPDGSKIYRANTFLENIIARMNDWETLKNPDDSERTPEDRKRYFVTWLDSCCGIAYKAKSTKLKLQLVCPQLMGIAKDFNEAFLPVDYASFPGQELDSSSQNFVQDGWLALLEGKEDVYRNYLEMLKAITGNDTVPNFWKRQNTVTDELRAVYVSNLVNSSNANGFNNLNNYDRFLRRRSPELECEREREPAVEFCLQGADARDSLAEVERAQAITLTPEGALTYIKENRAAVLARMTDEQALLLQHLALKYLKKRFP